MGGCVLKSAAHDEKCELAAIEGLSKPNDYDGDRLNLVCREHLSRVETYSISSIGGWAFSCGQRKRQGWRDGSPICSTIIQYDSLGGFVQQLICDVTRPHFQLSLKGWRECRQRKERHCCLRANRVHKRGSLMRYWEWPVWQSQPFASVSCQPWSSTTRTS